MLLDKLREGLVTEENLLTWHNDIFVSEFSESLGFLYCNLQTDLFKGTDHCEEDFPFMMNHVMTC